MTRSYANQKVVFFLDHSYVLEIQLFTFKSALKLFIFYPHLFFFGWPLQTLLASLDGYQILYVVSRNYLLGSPLD